ncbi:YjfB family protein [Thioalkalivibrio sp. ALJT]|uniref:YjfB family protein n=1 Tax=Thioalkalivibrio sp. ALJT TaxID=1158146 RepID=UPI0003632011|nr:YjfB family protein [Thioalkalivibrio sp. ALJT]
MDASAIAAMATQNSQQQLALQKDVAVQKKAMESQEVAAQALLQTMPDIGEMQASTQGLPDNIGTHINTTA